MGKSTEVKEMNCIKNSIYTEMDFEQARAGLYAAFQLERGALTAFAKEKQVTVEWLRMVFIGKYEDVDLLIEAADFLLRYKEEKATRVATKSRVFVEKVQSLA
jgi:hypothetical protein